MNKSFFLGRDHKVNGDMIVEYVNVGELKMVITCYKNSFEYFAIIRNALGLKLAKVPMNNCLPGKDFIQTFYVYRKSADGLQNVYRLSHEMSEDTSWYHGGMSAESSYWIYYFVAQSPTRNCYWEQVKLL